MEDERRLAEQQWRIAQTQLSEENSRRIDDIYKRLSMMEGDMQRQGVQIEENSKLAASIKQDTAAIVALWHGAAAIRKFLTWFVPLLTSLVTGLATYLAIRK